MKNTTQHKIQYKHNISKLYDSVSYQLKKRRSSDRWAFLRFKSNAYFFSWFHTHWTTPEFNKGLDKERYSHLSFVSASILSYRCFHQLISFVVFRTGSPYHKNCTEAWLMWTSIHRVSLWNLINIFNKIKKINRTWYSSPYLCKVILIK